MSNLSKTCSAAEMMLALERETGSKISAAWGPAPSCIKLELVSLRAEIGEDAKPQGFMTFKHVEANGKHAAGETEERPVPTWLLQRFKKMALDKPGSQMAVGFFGQAINAKTKQPVNDFRILALA